MSNIECSPNLKIWFHSPSIYLFSKNVNANYFLQLDALPNEGNYRKDIMSMQERPTIEELKAGELKTPAAAAEVDGPYESYKAEHIAQSDFFKGKILGILLWSLILSLNIAIYFHRKRFDLASKYV